MNKKTIEGIINKLSTLSSEQLDKLSALLDQIPEKDEITPSAHEKINSTKVERVELEEYEEYEKPSVYDRIFGRDGKTVIKTRPKKTSITTTTRERKEEPKRDLMDEVLGRNN